MAKVKFKNGGEFEILDKTDENSGRGLSPIRNSLFQFYEQAVGTEIAKVIMNRKGSL